MTGSVTKDNYSKFTGCGTGNNNIMVSDKYLEDIVSDPQKRAEFKQKIEEIKDATKYMQNYCKGKGRELVASGFNIDEDGGLTSWSSTKSSASNNASVFGTTQTNNSSKNAIIEKMEKNREKRRLEQKEQEEKRIEKNKLERKERQEDEEKRLEEKRQEKKLAEKSAITEANDNYDDNAINNRNRLAIDKYKTELGYENRSTSFNEEI